MLSVTKSDPSKEGILYSSSFSSLVPPRSIDLCSSFSFLHQLHLRAIGADDVLAIGDETVADQRGLATRADEAVVMPMSVLERDEASAADTSDWFGACSASLGE